MDQKIIYSISLLQVTSSAIRSICTSSYDTNIVYCVSYDMLICKYKINVTNENKLEAILLSKFNTNVPKASTILSHQTNLIIAGQSLEIQLSAP